MQGNVFVSVTLCIWHVLLWKKPQLTFMRQHSGGKCGCWQQCTVFQQNQIKTLNPWIGKNRQYSSIFTVTSRKPCNFLQLGSWRLRALKTVAFCFHFLSFIHSLSLLIALWSVNISITPQAPEDAWEKGEDHTGKNKVQNFLNITWLHVFMFSWQALDVGILSSSTD